MNNKITKKAEFLYAQTKENKVNYEEALKLSPEQRLIHALLKKNHRCN
jgi:hypothetical protein